MALPCHRPFFSVGSADDASKGLQPNFHLQWAFAISAANRLAWSADNAGPSPACVTQASVTNRNAANVRGIGTTPNEKKLSGGDWRRAKCDLAGSVITKGFTRRSPFAPALG